MNKLQISIKKLLRSEDRKVEAIVTELEASSEDGGSAPRWNELLLPSTKGGKQW